MHGLSGQLNFVWSSSFDTGSSNRGFTFFSDFQNPYNINRAYSRSDYDTPLNVNFTLVYEIPKAHSLPKLLGEGWQVNSLFRAQEGRPFSVYVSADPSNQGLKSTYANYDGSPLHYNYHDANHFFNTAAFSDPDPNPTTNPCGCLGNTRRNFLRQPGISQLDMGIFKNFKLTERFSVKFKWEVFNVFNHAMFAAVGGTTPAQKVGDSSLGTFFATPDVGIGNNPVLGTGAQRNMQFGIAVAF